MEKIKRFFDCLITTENCNLRCHYCYITQMRKFNSSLAHFDYDVEYVRKALSKNRLGGTCLFNFCAGGETLLSAEVLPIAKELLDEGHFVMIVTNGTLTERFKEISKWDRKLLSHLFFKFSFHYLELERLNLFDKFFNNIDCVRKAGCSFTLEITPSDELVPYIDKIKDMSLEKVGALPHITIPRDNFTLELLSKYTMEEFLEIWGSFDSELLRFKSSSWGIKRKEYCYAGDWSFVLNLTTGDLHQCYCGKKVDNVYLDISKPVKYCAVGHNCSMAHCFNGHAFLALGVIPELVSPTFAVLRDRETNVGGGWLYPEVRDFFNQKLVDANEEYTDEQKKQNERKYNKLNKKSLRGHLANIKWLRKIYKKIRHKDN